MRNQPRYAMRQQLLSLFVLMASSAYVIDHNARTGTDISFATEQADAQPSDAASDGPSPQEAPALQVADVVEPPSSPPQSVPQTAAAIPSSPPAAAPAPLEPAAQPRPAPAPVTVAAADPVPTPKPTPPAGPSPQHLPALATIPIPTPRPDRPTLAMMAEPTPPRPLPPMPSQPAPAEHAAPQPVAQVAPTAAGRYRDGTYKGSIADAYYGLVQVEATIRDGRLASIHVLRYPADRRTSRYISGRALPALQREAIAAQSARVDIISGATLVSRAYRRSLGTALSRAKT